MTNIIYQYFIHKNACIFFIDPVKSTVAVTRKFRAVFDVFKDFKRLYIFLLIRIISYCQRTAAFTANIYFATTLYFFNFLVDQFVFITPRLAKSYFILSIGRLDAYHKIPRLITEIFLQREL
ncbi:hypothetical protein D3C80_775380 [compost metagenome]